MTDEVENFIEAVREDEYAELELSTGDTLITDWQGDGFFLPYVEPGFLPEELPEDKLDSVADEIAYEIEQELDAPVHRIEWSNSNQCFYPDMDKSDLV